MQICSFRPFLAAKAAYFSAFFCMCVKICLVDRFFHDNILESLGMCEGEPAVLNFYTIWQTENS